jgi:hypothetical protein
LSDLFDACERHPLGISSLFHFPASFSRRIRLKSHLQTPQPAQTSVGDDIFSALEAADSMMKDHKSAARGDLARGTARQQPPPPSKRGDPSKAGQASKQVVESGKTAVSGGGEGEGGEEGGWGLTLKRVPVGMAVSGKQKSYLLVKEVKGGTPSEKAGLMSGDRSVFEWIRHLCS